jgi:phage-related protein
MVGPSARPGLRRLIRGLTAYGIVGLILSAVAIVALVVALGRLGAVSESVGGSSAQLGTVLDRMATVLDGASSSARSFGSTIDSGGTALTTAAADIRAIVPQLRGIESQANAISILGQQPLAPLAGLFGQIAGQLGDLDGQLDAVARNLTDNRAALTTNADSLADLARETRTLEGRLTPAAIAHTIDDARWVAIALLAVVVAGAALPAIGALAFARWLLLETRRIAAGSPDAGPQVSSGGTPG